MALGDAFDVDADEAKGEGLMSIYEAYLANKSSTGSTTTGSTASQPQAAKKTVSAADKTAAEQLKAEGNALISQRLYSSAIDKYTQAIALDPGNAVYWSNRAAAWGAMGEHGKAVQDAEEAVRVDEGFGRGWSRLG